MRIAIITLPLQTNYGGILQAYALQTVLERMGHTVEILQKNDLSFHNKWFIPLVYVKRLVKKIFFDKTICLLAEKKELRERAICQQHTSRFINTYINLRQVDCLSDVSESDYDVILVGSDQVWRRIYYAKIYRNVMLSVNPADAFLKFAENWNVKKVAYAASFGVDSWEYTSEETKDIILLIQKFDNVSVREDSGVELCQKYLGRRAQHIIDPTMLLNKLDYEALFKVTNTLCCRGSLVSYILNPDNDKTRLVEHIAKEQSWQAVELNSKVENGSASIEERIHPPVEQWLKGIYEANFVVTDSFHACVFSILFSKPFVVLANQERGNARLVSLMKMFNLEKHLLTNIYDFTFSDDYIISSSVFDKLKDYQLRAKEFLSQI